MNKIKIFIWSVLIIVPIVVIKFIFFSPDVAKSPSPSQQKLQPVIVTAYVARSEKITNTIFATGTILANEEVQLVPEISGKIININFKEGTGVSKGDLLVKINDADLQAQLSKLLIQEKLAHDSEVRDKAMLAVNGISQMQYDAALAHLNSVKADIEILRSQIAKTEIRAPFNGTIGLKRVSEGSYVTQNSIIAIIDQLDRVKIDFFIPEKYSSLVRVNDTIRFSTEGKEASYSASIIAIEPQIDVTTRTLQVRASAPNKSGKFFPGAFAKINFPLNVYENVVMIPTEAIIPILKGEKVFVSKNGKAQEVIVKTGLRTDKTVEILDGIQKGDTVITTGIMQLKPGSLLKITAVK